MSDLPTIARERALNCEAKNVFFVSADCVILFIGGEYVLVDFEDFPRIAPYKWSFTRGKSGPKYARAYVGGGRSKPKFARMHRFIMGTQIKLDIDHINGDGLDNRRANLRELSRSANLINGGLPKHNTSGIRGVCWYPTYNKWKAYINVGRKHKTIGYFQIQSDAIAARKSAEEKYFPGIRAGARR